MILLTGAGGMLGRYLQQEFKDEKILSLGLRDESDFKTDLRKEEPEFGDTVFSTVIHTAGTEEDTDAMALNLEGTKRLVKGLEKNLPENFVYVSSHKVYSRDAGEDITEEANVWASDEAGKSKALAEEFLKSWAADNGVTLTIIRPARMFGNGVKGETLMLFNDALRGKYIHIRWNDAKVSLVCAYDVAKGIRRLYDRGGVYNAAEGNNVKFIDMVESLTANAGAKKRMTHLSAPWAEWLWRLGRWVPSVDRHLHPEVVEARMKTKTLDGRKFAEAAGITYHDTIAVIERREKQYPYTDGKDRKAPEATREV